MARKPNANELTAVIALVLAAIAAAVILSAVIGQEPANPSIRGIPQPVTTIIKTIGPDEGWILIDQRPKRSIVVRKTAITGFAIYDKGTGYESPWPYIKVHVGGTNFRLDVIEYDLARQFFEDVVETGGLKVGVPIEATNPAD